MNIPGIYIAALFTSIVAAVQLTMIIRRAEADERTRLWAVVALTLPMQPLAFYLVRVPLNHGLASCLGRNSDLYQWLTTLYAPLTEEAAKLVALLVPMIYREIRPTNFVRYSLTIGISFAIGEMWFIAERVTHQSGLAALPSYQFVGYVMERLMTCVFHSTFVAITL